MIEYKTFDDYAKNTFNIEPSELTHISLEEQKKKTVAITVDELINIWNELTELKLKTDIPKWHKVADGDLPKEKKEYWCKVFYYESEEVFNAFLWFDPSTKEFKFLENIEEDEGSIFKVKAWCDVIK